MSVGVSQVDTIALTLGTAERLRTHLDEITVLGHETVEVDTTGYERDVVDVLAVDVAGQNIDDRGFVDPETGERPLTGLPLGQALDRQAEHGVVPVQRPFDVANLQDNMIEGGDIHSHMMVDSP